MESKRALNVRKSSLLLATLAIATSTEAWSAPMRCDFTEKYQCNPGSGCQPNVLGVWVVVDLDSKLYQRCDRNGCDTYDAVVSDRKGAFITIDLPARGVFMKIGQDSRATEVVSLGNSVIVSQGVCR